jgi:diguanylate cyclase (GGDEF)-like protein
VLKDRMSGRLVVAVERAVAEASNRVARRQVEEQQSQLNNELRQLATHDSLTGAASRPLFLERLQEALARIRPQAPDTALFLIDLDHFKQINVTYGATFADQILVETARRLSGLCGEKDLVGNLGGDKFILILCRDGLELKLPALLKEIQDCFNRPFHLRNLDITVEASLGGVVLRVPEDTTADVLAQCDEAMRQVKHGKQRSIFMVDESTIRELKRRNLLDSEIQEAVNTKSLFLLFQPIVSLKTGRIHGAEGLLRFRQKDGHILPAAEFMQALIRTSSLSLIDEAVISDFLASARGRIEPLLRDKGFRFSFNISPGILANVGYATKILAQIDGEGAAPGSFTLEILEEGLMPTNETVQKNLTQLQQAGVHVAVDDFGMGYSDLRRLSQLPINELKIPRELIGGIRLGDAKLNAVLKAAVGIAKVLGLFIVAEGVEELDEANYLRELGCDYGQGYLYGKAMPLEDLITLVEKQVTGTADRPMLVGDS